MEKSIIDTVKNSSKEKLEDNICKLGFVKIYESKYDSWFLYEDGKYISVLNEDRLNLYEKEIELHYE